MPLKIDGKFQGKLTCAFQNDMRDMANFHRLKNSDFILESKIAELNQNKNSKQLFIYSFSLYLTLAVKLHF